jgi:tight adherence protein C
METILALIDGFGDDPVITLAVLGVAGGALAAYVVFGFARDRQGLRRRAAAGTDTPEPARAPGKPERPRSLERLVSFIDENIAGDTRQNRVLRRQLIQAGFFDPRAGAVYSRRGSALPSSSASPASSSCPC